MAFIRKRPGDPRDPYPRPDQPHHIHIDPTCSGDPATCDDSHWQGGRPQADHPHHVEIDCETGLVAFTRLTDEEIADLEQLWAFEAEQREITEAAARDRIARLRDRAKTDPFARDLLEHLGLAD